MNKKNKKFVLIHGMSSYLDDCFGIAVKERLKNHGYEIIEPFFPLGKQLSLEGWSQVMDNFLDQIDDNTCFLCHSLGCVFIIKYLFSRKLKANTIISVAGADFDANHPLGKDFPQLFAFKETDEEYHYFKNNTKAVYNIYSDTDHLLSLDILVAYTKKTGATGILIKNKGHFGRTSGVKDIPEIEQILDKIIK